MTTDMIFVVRHSNCVSMVRTEPKFTDAELCADVGKADEVDIYSIDKI